MFDFEATIKLIVALGSGAGVLLMIGIGVKVLFRRRLPETLDHDQLEGLEERLLRTEARVQELEERLDFAERMLTEVRGRAQLPGS